MVTSGLGTFHALHATLQDVLLHAAQRHWMLALCAKTKQILYLVPAGCLRRREHIVFECPALQNLRHNLVQAPQFDAKILFMWQDDFGFDCFIGACSKEEPTSAGPPVGDQPSDQP